MLSKCPDAHCRPRTCHSYDSAVAKRTRAANKLLISRGMGPSDHIGEMINEFLQNKTSQKLELPGTLTSWERQNVHTILSVSIHPWK